MFSTLKSTLTRRLPVCRYFETRNFQHQARKSRSKLDTKNHFEMIIQYLSTIVCIHCPSPCFVLPNGKRSCFPRYRVHPSLASVESVYFSAVQGPRL